MTILDDAAQAVRDRDGSYGNPSDNLARIAGIWTHLFDRTFTAHDVAVAMIAVKLSRLTESPGHRDSLVDVAGYARTIERLSTPPR